MIMTVGRHYPACVHTRVVVADDNVIVREGVRALLADEDDVDVVGSASSYAEVVDVVGRERPDVLVTDIRMPPTMTDEGIRAARVLRRDDPDLGVVVLSQHDEPAYALTLLEDGVRGLAYLLKDRVSEPDQIAAAVRSVRTGGSVIDPRIVEAMVTAQTRRAGPLQVLTAREREVLGEMATGATNTAIAERLYITVRAVERHINSIFSKLGLGEETDYHRRVRAVLVYLSEQH
jgi:DNA-binding NarL/FixJ family response regulator